MASLAPRLDLRQSQSLVMTPQLQQAIKLLALSNLEIESFIAEELEKNPLLETGSDERGPDDAPGFEADEWDGDEPPEPVTADRLVEHGDGVGDSPLDVDLVAETFHHDSAGDMQGLDGSLGLSGGASGGLSEDGIDFDSFAGEAETLQDHLMAQAGEQLSGRDHGIGTQIIGQIDETGYLTGTLDEIAQRLAIPLADAERVLAVVQGFDPSGVGARDLAECLAIQLRERDRLDPAMAALLAHLDLVARHDHAALLRLCGVDAEDLAEMLAELRNLNPKPGNAFGDSIVQPVIPDVLVRPAPDGSWAVELNSGTLPRVLVNQTYYAKVARGPKKDTDKAYLADCLQTANWLVKSLDQRARTILKVASEIVRQQDAFFAEGVQHLRPLNLKTVAEAIGMHESTVSRVTSNKYMATTRGIFEMKYFFTASIPASGGGEAHSAEAVRYRIRKLIDDEPANAILSDDTIVKILGDSGIDIARRTVAKYREAMRIPSSVQRRREKQAAL